MRKHTIRVVAVMAGVLVLAVATGMTGNGRAEPIDGASRAGVARSTTVRGLEIDLDTLSRDRSTREPESDGRRAAPAAEPPRRSGRPAGTGTANVVLRSHDRAIP